MHSYKYIYTCYCSLTIYIVCRHYLGYDKLTLYGFPIHGCVDGASRNVMWLKAAGSTELPQVVSQLLLSCFEENKKCFARLIGNGGTENVYAAAIMNAIGGPNAYIVGTSKGTIDSFWGRLTQNLGMQKWVDFFKMLCNKDGGAIPLYDHEDPYQKLMAQYTFGGLLNADLQAAQDTWNFHRMNPVKRINFPGGIPALLYKRPQDVKIGWKDGAVPLPPHLMAFAEERGYTYDLSDPFSLNCIKPILDAAIVHAGFTSVTHHNKLDVFIFLSNNYGLKLQLQQFAITMLALQNEAVRRARGEAAELHKQCAGMQSKWSAPEVEEMEATVNVDVW
jgi:hypothetical protein